ncbi:hypothetical protein [Streptomyces sp. NPDC002785]|uniref:hypothetical protein n=1 Tax=Streptomyces sp. NPDC002785 TaxID=3154543 RepID=UPI003319F623
MRARFTLPQTADPRILQGLDSLKEGLEYVVLEVFAQYEKGVQFRVEVVGEDSALFNSRAFVVTSHSLPPTWKYFQFETGSFALRPESWNQLGFWESYYDREPKAVEIYEAEKRKILSAS